VSANTIERYADNHVRDDVSRVCSSGIKERGEDHESGVSFQCDTPNLFQCI
jgi:hypothetical protein